MIPRKKVLLICDNEFRSAELKLVMDTRLQVNVVVAYGLGIVSAVHDYYFHCAVLTHSSLEEITFLRAKEIPTLELGHAPSFADRAVSSNCMADVLQVVRLMCARKRGPKARAA